MAHAKPEPMIDVLIVDDSVVARGMLTRFAETDPAIRVVGAAPDGASALAFLTRTRAEVVLLDIAMPGMHGLAVLPKIVRQWPRTRVIIVSAHADAETRRQALDLGATACLEKPRAGGGAGAVTEFRRNLTDRIKAHKETAPRRPRVSKSAEAPDIIAIGSSTGGPPALLRIFAELGASLRQPVLITQHLPTNFFEPLANQLARASGANVAVAIDGEPIVDGKAYMAPGRAHLTVVRSGLDVRVKLLRDAPPEHFCKPAVDPMLRSVAETYGAAALAIILTGMGADGALGCEAIANAGGRFIVQDRDTSSVWGMPAAAAKTGLAEAVLPLGDIAAWLKHAAQAAHDRA